jgi:PmbA protein
LRLNVFLDNALKRALSEGADQAEVFTVKSRTLSLYVEDSKVKNLEEKLDAGISVKVADGKKLGEASSTIASPEQVEMCTDSAIKAARVSEPDSFFQGFGLGGEAVISKPQVWDEDVACIDAQTLSSKGMEIVDACIGIGDVKVPRGLIRTASIETEIGNSNGMSTSHRSTMVYLHFTSMTSSGVAGEGEESFFSTRLDMDTSAIGASIAQGAINSARAVTFRGRSEVPVFIQAASLAEMFKTSVGFSIDSENVNRMRSAWVGKIGKEVASPSISIVDDPTDPRGILSATHDDEGTPTSKRSIVERGVLKSSLFDGYNASMAGVKSTGNGLRRTAEDSQSIYQMPVHVSPINMVVKPGSKDRDDLISSFDKAVLIERFAWPQVNPMTGAVGLEVRCAHIMEKGEIIETVKHALLTGNFFDSLKKVVGVANDHKVQGSWIVPTMGFDGMELVGNP